MFKFVIESGKAYFNDPCYDDVAPLPTRNGNWIATTEVCSGPFNGLVDSFTAYHEDFGPDVGEIEVAYGGVDSGQYGFFDASIYGLPNYDEPGFYRDCCDITLAQPPYGVVHGKGFVCASGFGDGRYHCFVSKVDGQVVSVHINFGVSGRFEFANI